MPPSGPYPHQIRGIGNHLHAHWMTIQYLLSISHYSAPVVVTTRCQFQPFAVLLTVDTPALCSGKDKDKDKDNCTDNGCLLGYRHATSYNQNSPGTAEPPGTPVSCSAVSRRPVSALLLRSTRLHLTRCTTTTDIARRCLQRATVDY